MKAQRIGVRALLLHHSKPCDTASSACLRPEHQTTSEPRKVRSNELLFARRLKGGAHSPGRQESNPLDCAHAWHLSILIPLRPLFLPLLSLLPLPPLLHPPSRPRI